MASENPTLNNGKYAGESITRVPVGYLRWMVNIGHAQADIAEAELNRRGTVFPECEISGHAIDRASVKCNLIWRETRLEDEGLHAWLVRMVQEALTSGEYLEDDRYSWNGMILVIRDGQEYPSLVTIMPVKE